MKLGVHLPQWGAHANRRGVLDVARAAEDAGLDSVWVADHIVFPTESASAYPYRARGVPFAPEDGFLEAATVLALVAGATDRVTLGTSVLVLPMREPLLVAKTFATLDVLSQGRVLLALGVGWWEEEFNAVGAPFADRGKRFVEEVEILRKAWRLGTFAHNGHHHQIDEVACLPRPPREAGIPLLLGGTTDAALRRAGRLGDGWHAVGANPEMLASGRLAVEAAAEAAGRNSSELVFTTTCAVRPDGEQAVERLGALREIGLDHVVMSFAGVSTPRETCAAIEHLAATVRPQIDSARDRPAQADDRQRTEPVRRERV